MFWLFYYEAYRHAQASCQTDMSSACGWHNLVYTIAYILAHIYIYIYKWLTVTILFYI